MSSCWGQGLPRNLGQGRGNWRDKKLDLADFGYNKKGVLRFSKPVGDGDAATPFTKEGKTKKYYLLHASGSQMDGGNLHVAALEQDFHCILVDLPGHG